MTMSTSQPVADVATVNPFTELPVIGGVVELLDDALADLGAVLWMAEVGEFILLAVLVYHLVRLVVRKVFPWLRTVLQPVVGVVADVVLAVLVLPDFVLTRAMSRYGKVPPTVVYLYGDGLFRALEVVKSLVTRVLPVIGVLERMPRLAIWGLSALVFLSWNQSTCVTSSVTTTCVRPAGHWTTQAETWFDEPPQVPPTP